MPSSIIAFLSPAFIFALNCILFRDYSKDLINSIDVCKGVQIQEVKKNISLIINFFRDEINRLFIIQNANGIDISRLEAFEIREFNLDNIKAFLKSIREANKYINRLKPALSRIKTYKWILIVILFLATIEFLINIIFDLRLEIIEVVLIVFSVLILLIFIIDYALISNLRTEIREKYGI